jgi:nucleoside-diphosphate-sugar epimerase
VNQEAEIPTAAITGANGYVGSIMAEALTAEGFQIRRLVRRPRPETTDHRYEITKGCPPDTLKGVDVLVHCAYDFSATSRTEVWATNVYGTRSLFDVAVSSGVRRTIFVSSMSAYPGTRQIYGRGKLASESDAFARGMTVIRPGLIYGPGWGGMAGILKKLTSLPLVPLVGRHAHQFTLHEDDLRRAITVLAKADVLPSRPIGLAHPSPVPFEQLLRVIAMASADHEPRFVPVPWVPLFWAIRAVESTPLRLPVRADSLLGLVRSAPSVPNIDDLKDLGIELRPFTL